MKWVLVPGGEDHVTYKKRIMGAGKRGKGEADRSQIHLCKIQVM